MKRIVLSLLLTLVAGSAFAGRFPPTREDWMFTPAPSYSSQGVYRSTYMTLLVPSTAAVIISTYPSILYGVAIGSPTGNSSLTLYDQRIATSEVVTPAMFTISNGFAWQFQPLNIYFSSGIVAIPGGSVNPNNLLIYREK